MNISIRPWRIEDAPALSHALSNPAILCRLRDGIPYPYTENDARAYISQMLSAGKNSTFAYAIVLDGTAVGSIAAFRQDNIHCRTAELGYYLAQEHWGKGIMTAAVSDICKAVFAETNIVRIFAMPFASNFGSRRVLEKAGFQFEGIMKYNAFKDGSLLDTALYALTRREKEI